MGADHVDFPADEVNYAWIVESCDIYDGPLSLFFVRIDVSRELNIDSTDVVLASGHVCLHGPSASSDSGIVIASVIRSEIGGEEFVYQSRFSTLGPRCLEQTERDHGLVGLHEIGQVIE